MILPLSSFRLFTPSSKFTCTAHDVLYTILASTEVNLQNIDLALVREIAPPRACFTLQCLTFLNARSPSSFSRSPWNFDTWSKVI